MKTLTLSMIILMFTSCGKEYVTTTEYKTQDFEGYYYCDNNSNIELVTDFNNSVTVDSFGQSLNSVNPQNNTIGTHPLISYRDLVINGNKLIISPRNYTYSSSTHDLENDVSGSNITGSKRTDVSMTLVSENVLSISIKIYSGAINTNINNIILNRTFTCSK